MTEADPARGRRSIDDSIDLARLHARDRTLLTTLVRDLSPRISASIRRYALSDEDAHELLQDCWVQILDRLDAFKHRGSFTAWAIAVSRNVGRTRLRRSRRGRKRTVALDDVAKVPSDELDPLELAMARREREIVFDAVASLPDRERDAIVLRLFEGRSTQESAEILGVAPGAVRNILQRAMYRLRRMKRVRLLIQDWMDDG